jgi:hypothetical protein
VREVSVTYHISSLSTFKTILSGGLLVGPAHPIIRLRRRDLQSDACTAVASHRVTSALEEQRSRKGAKRLTLVDARRH